jgi:hypothetical protein
VFNSGGLKRQIYAVVFDAEFILAAATIWGLQPGTAQDIISAAAAGAHRPFDRCDGLPGGTKRGRKGPFAPSPGRRSTPR